ncbi:MAG: hypothetical protein AAGA54_02130 [Myxococcota bacterium]
MVPLRRFAGLIAATLTLGLPCAASAQDDAACEAQVCASLSVVLKARGERQPLAQSRVIIIPSPEGAEEGPLQPPPPLPENPAWQRVATTDDAGSIQVLDVPSGRVRVIVVAPGYERFEAVVQTGRAKPTTLFVPTSEETSYRTVVETSGGPPRAEVPSQLLSREEIRTLPGSQGDPLRALQNLPGVGRTPGNLGLLILRGASPDQSRVYMGGHALPRAFHVLSVASVFPAEVLDELRLVPGNFDAAYGNATGGVVLIEPRAGRRDGLHGFSEIDIAAASTMLEGPLGKGSFVVGAQRGYADLLLNAADRISERVTGETSSTLRPTYYDYQGMLDFPWKRGTWSVRAFGAGDRLQTPDTDQGALARGGFDYRTSFHRVDAAVRAAQDGWRFWWTPSFRYESGRLFFDAGDQEQIRRDYVLSMRGEMSRRFSRRFTWLLGTDLEVDGFVATSESSLGLPPGTPPSFDRVRGLETALGVYTTAPLDLGRVHLVPGARGNAFTTRTQAAFSFDPRVAATVDVADRWRILAAVGKYSQAREVTETATLNLLDQGASFGDASVFYPPAFTRFQPSVGFAPGNRQLTVRQALHVSLGGEVALDDDVDLEVTAFAREQDNATPTLFDGQRIDFATREHNIGAQALLRKRLTNKLYGWIGYTLMWSQLRFVETAPGEDIPSRPSDFDQRHNFNLVASYILPKNWRIGGRFRVVSGFPFTPVIGSINLAEQRGAVQGRRNEGRLGTFHQLDLRIDKRWIRDRAIITGYVDVQNVYNRQNPEAVLYSADFRRQEDVIGIPIFPTLGLRVDY